MGFQCKLMIIIDLIDVPLEVQEQEAIGEGGLWGCVPGRGLKRCVVCAETYPGQNDRSGAASEGVSGRGNLVYEDYGFSPYHKIVQRGRGLNLYLLGAGVLRRGRLGQSPGKA